ncbi:helix-turn-helix domain-containing protein [Hymenobacter terrenus]|uniref:helix-turn-helix domain-containing protein n=1 Tax=Hymenobacter terrenus TaxID=1629124 RepID=UPI000619B116|nr:helix-turn-helix transcriptional regulator [Hymenobacter terrenus]
MSYVPSLREVRTRFDLRQRELATWLGLSLSQLSRVEIGYDPLPMHAVPLLLPWLTALTLPAEAETPLTPSPADAGPPPAGPAPLLARLAECRYQAQRLHWQRAAQQARLGVLRARLAAGPLLRAALPPALPDAAAEPAHSPVALRRRWLARLLEAAADELGPAEAAEALLAARQHGWQCEAAWLEAYLTDTPA